MITLFSTVHVIVCLFLILVVLLQQGKGADLSVFGGGGSQAAFGARGATTLLHKLTVFAFVGFIVTTLAIGLLKTSQRNSSVITDLPVSAPATEAAATEEAAEAALPTVLQDLAPAATEEAAPSAAEDAPAASGDGGGDDQ